MWVYLFKIIVGFQFLQLSSPIVARDHYKGKKHKKAIDNWMQNHKMKKSSSIPFGKGRDFFVVVWKVVILISCLF